MYVAFKGNSTWTRMNFLYLQFAKTSVKCLHLSQFNAAHVSCFLNVLQKLVLDANNIFNFNTIFVP